MRVRVSTELRRDPPLSISDLALRGKDVMDLLGTPGGRDVGDALRHLLEVVLDDPGANTRASLSGHLGDWWRVRRRGESASRES